MPVGAVETHVVFDATSGLTRIGGLHETNRSRELALQFDRLPDGSHRLTVQTTSERLADAIGTRAFECDLQVTELELWALVHECRTVWQAVADTVVNGRYVFQDEWDHRRSPEHLASAERKLAIAGRKLFQGIFRPRYNPGDESAQKRQRFVDAMIALKTDDLWIKVNSDSFFAPWNMVFTGEVEGAPIDRRGFWGYSYLIDHVPPAWGAMGNDLVARRDQRLKLGFLVDKNLDRALQEKQYRPECLKPVLDLIANRRGQLTFRNRKFKDDLKQELRTRADDQLMYFCCHAEVEGSGQPLTQGRLRLSDVDDDGWIVPSDLGLWLQDKEPPKNFVSSPLVFLNACEGGQMSSAFYLGFARAFLNEGAAGVIGPQCEIPALFAGEFGRRFLELFLQGGINNKVGTILLNIRRQFYDDHHNPLGLAYSCYRGTDIFLR